MTNQNASNDQWFITITGAQGQETIEQASFDEAAQSLRLVRATCPTVSARIHRAPQPVISMTAAERQAMMAHYQAEAARWGAD